MGGGIAMKMNYLRSICFLFILSFALAPPRLLAGQTIVINGDVRDLLDPLSGHGNNVYGNGEAGTGWGILDDTMDNLGDPRGNTVIVNGGVIAGWVTGSSRRPALDVDPFGNAVIEVTGNRVIFNSGVVENEEVFGGYGQARGTDPANHVTVTDNHVIIQGDADVGDVYGGYGEAGAHRAPSYGAGSVLVSGNSVTIREKAVVEIGTTPWLFMEGLAGGGVGYIFGDGSTVVTDNHVRIEDEAYVHSHAYGGGSQIDGRGTFSVTNNSLTVTGGTVIHSIYGGYSMGEDAPGDDARGDITNNTVTISGDAITIGGDIYGGYAFYWSWDGVIRGDATATENTVNISGSPDISASMLHGGRIEYGPDSVLPPPIHAPGMDAFTGNTLNARTRDRSIVGLESFNYMNFSLTGDMASGDTVFVASGEARLRELPGGADRLTTVGLAVEQRPDPLNEGDYFILIDTDDSVAGANLIGEAENSTAYGGKHGVTLHYEFDIWKGDTAKGTTRATGADPAGHQLVASLARTTADPGTEAVSRGVLIDLAMLLNRGADLAAEEGLARALEAACPQGVNVFAALAGDASRYDVGQRMEVSGLALLTGLATGLNTGGACLTVGGFFEYGAASYEADSEFELTGSVHGDGRNQYLGGGALARMQSANTGLYMEAGLRAGEVRNRYNTGLRDLTGRRARYETATAYYGAHLGAGRVWRVADSIDIDIHAAYLWTRRQGDSATLTTGEAIDFANADSQRVRAGVRLSHALSDRVRIHAGVDYEHEFAATARSAHAGRSLIPSSLSGGTAVGELGVGLAPLPGQPLYVDVLAQGAVGRRKGVGGSVRVGYEF